MDSHNLKNKPRTLTGNQGVNENKTRPRHGSMGDIDTEKTLNSERRSSLAEDNSSSTGTKRKTRDSLGTSDLNPYKRKERSEAYVLREALEAIFRISEEIHKNMEQNTKRELKELDTRLIRQVKVLNRDIIQGFLEEHRWEQNKMTHDAAEQTDPVQTERVTTREIGCQTSNPDAISSLPSNMDYDAFKGIKELNWDEGAYTNTTLVRGNTQDLWNLNNEGAVLILCKEGKEEVPMNILQKFPELEEPTGDPLVMVEGRHIVTSGQGRTVHTSRVVKLVYTNEQELFLRLKEMKDMVGEEAKIRTINNTLTSIELRKILEAIYHGCPGTVEILESGPRSANMRPYAVVVETGSDYKADLRDIKLAIASSNVANNIKEIRSTRQGKLLITTSGRDETTLINLGETIRKLEGKSNAVVERRGLKESATIYIRGMDALASMKEVEAAITQELGGKPALLQPLGELRPLQNNTQSATVRLDKYSAETLINRGEVRVGLVTCRVERQLKLDRCRKCWQYGHHMKDCKATDDKSDCCIKCGEKGHSKKNCSEKDPKCVLCKTSHGNSGEQCPAFKAALAAARKEARKELRKQNRNRPRTTSGEERNTGSIKEIQDPVAGLSAPTGPIVISS